MRSMTLLLTLLFLPFHANAFEILALGTSNTNCKNAGQAYTNQLNYLLLENSLNAKVINSGVDGDKPIWMLQRLESTLAENKNIKLVIFEPGPNERYKPSNIEPSEKILQFLEKIQMPTIYVSHSLIQSESEAQIFAEKFNAAYYGHWNKGVPTDYEHRQFDMPGSAGHMTAKGCQLWAKNIFPIIKMVVETKKIK